MSSSDAPTTALVAAFVTLRAFFLVLSSSVPFSRPAVTSAVRRVLSPRIALSSCSFCEATRWPRVGDAGGGAAAASTDVFIAWHGAPVPVNKT